MVGGAPVSENFAKQIGADGFAADAVEAVTIAKQLIARHR
jgi:methanogenic corrinoid protein MtbC1